VVLSALRSTIKENSVFFFSQISPEEIISDSFGSITSIFGSTGISRVFSAFSI
jgi:hypothetical protein